MSKGEKSIWDLVVDQANGIEKDERQPKDEAAVFVIGSKNSGKTSIILRFLDRDETPKPTTALEYTYGRRARASNLAKDVAHIYELGGGTWLSKLMAIPLSADTLKNTALVMVLDLSQPNELWATLECLLNEAQSKVKVAMNELKNKNPELAQKMEQAAWERVGEDHPDKELLDPFPIPLAIIGSKYDLFQEFEPEKRKTICKTLRFVAHSYGATLIFFSSKQETLIQRTRALISHYVFGTNMSKTVQVDQNKPLLIPAGLDAASQIGSPPLSDDELGVGSAKTPLDLWKRAYCSMFPQENLNTPTSVEDPAKDIQYAEPAIDSMRKQKDEELERYRRLCERRAKEAEQQAMLNEGIAY
ncbi:cytoplasmic dynein 2 light intermediate chain 1 [Lingula anatina]|uniref:Cytoplasmic dynein 2 light intermediate chain 1 n=1 Tax=Lingula anatina TaxID=7574 RepID=A0A1S3IDT3_LINAN|nr:cytoplasmic dynein 2 light intermediate chain 1 [Lingula anatina]|eukprot:XP_013396318.1 cytoplasmic dynein 2 light intermediate chain 1 [Lingula anatina]